MGALGGKRDGTSGRTAASPSARCVPACGRSHPKSRPVHCVVQHVLRNPVPFNAVASTRPEISSRFPLSEAALGKGELSFGLLIDFSPMGDGEYQHAIMYGID